MAARLNELGLTGERDEIGNVLYRLGNGDGGGVMLCAHLDTVVPQAEIDPVVVEDGWENRHAGILGADNKAAVAMLLEVAARRASLPLPVELLFTVREESGLEGASAFDTGRLRSRFGYVFDHATPIGEIIVASPTAYRLEAEFHGTAAHAGIRPEDGRNAIVAAAKAIAAMPFGRIDPETTANVGRIEGGSASVNVVADRCRVEAECRSLDASAPTCSSPSSSTTSTTAPTRPSATSTSWSTASTRVTASAPPSRACRWPSRRCARAATRPPTSPREGQATRTRSKRQASVA